MSEYIFRFNDRIQSVTYDLIHVPSDLLDYGISYGKVKGIANIVKKHSNNLKFVKEDAEFLGSRLLDYGVNNRVELVCYRKEILGSTEYFEFSCFIDFENCQYINGVFECGLYEAGFYQLFDKHYSQSYDIGEFFSENTTLEYYGLKRKTSIKYNYSGNIVANGGYGNPMFIIGGTIDNNESNKLKNYDTMMFHEASGYGFQGSRGIQLLGKNYCYVNRYEENISNISGTCKYRLKLYVDEFRTKPFGGNVIVNIYAIIDHTESLGHDNQGDPLEYRFFGGGTIIGSNSHTFNSDWWIDADKWNRNEPFSMESEFNFNSNTNIQDITFFVEVQGLDNNENLSYNNHYCNCDVTYFNVDMNVIYQNGLSYLQVINYSTIINGVLSKINADNYYNITLITALLDSELKNKHVLIGGGYVYRSGENVTGYSANISIESILQALKGFFDIQMCIDVEEGNFRNVKIWFEKSGSGLNLIHDFKDNISEIAISPANELMFSTISIGSIVDESTEEDIIDYTKQRYYDTGNIVERNEYSFTPDNISGSVTEFEEYVKNIHRSFWYNIDPSISLTNESNKKFYSLNVEIQDVFSVDQIRYKLNRNFYLKVNSGMLYPEYAYNLYYTPYNLIQVNMREVSSLCYLSRVNELKNIGGQTENQIIFLDNGVQKSADASVNIQRSLAYYSPLYFEFTAPADIRLLQSYDNNRRGYFMFMVNGIYYKGIIAASTTDDADGVTIEPFNFKEANVKLLKMIK